MTTPGFFFLLLLLAALAFVGVYNRLVRLRQNVREAWSAIETELRRRYDLVPNLVAAVKGYAAHERETLDEVIRVRNAAVETGGAPAAQARAENALTGALRRLFAVSEAYPDLKASESFLDLHRQLVETEDRLSKARRYYNATVRDINTAVETFPTLLVAGALGFHSEDYFEIEDASARAAVEVNL